MVELQDRDPGAARRHRRRSRRLVWRAVLRAVLPDPDAESAGRHRADHDRDRARSSARRASSCSAALSDRIGRKPIMLAGFALAAVTYFYIFQGITHFANPKLEQALANAPVTVTADPAECSFQFKATGTEKFTTGCDIIKSALVSLSVNYNNVTAPAGTKASVQDRRSDHRRRHARPRQDHRRRGEGARLSGKRRPQRHQLSDDGAAAGDPGHLRDHGLRADRRLAGGVVPDPHPL